jgi:Mrp family chromosome partitioning ATPase
MGKKVLLIDANFTNPGFQKIYSIKEDKGIDGTMSCDAIQSIVTEMDSGLYVIPSKRISDKPSIIFRNIDFKGFIENNKDQYDVVIMDATSINSMKDVSFILEYCDGTVLIIDEGKLQWQMLKNSIPRIKHKNAIILGGILNNRTFPIPELVYRNFKYFID